MCRVRRVRRVCRERRIRRICRTQIQYQNKHCNINQKDEGTWDDRGRDEGTNFILRIKEQEIRLTLQEHDDDGDDNDGDDEVKLCAEQHKEQDH